MLVDATLGEFETLKTKGGYNHHVNLPGCTDNILNTMYRYYIKHNVQQQKTDGPVM